MGQDDHAVGDAGAAEAHDDPQTVPKAPLEVSRTVLLHDTRQHGRCTARLSNDELPAPLPKIPTPSSEPQTKLQLLRSQLDKVQALKRHYIGYYKAYLAHLPALATSLHKSEHPLVLNIPDKRTKRAPATPSQSKPNTSAQSPHGTEEGPAASDSKVMSQNKPSGDTLATFSDAEEDAVEAAMATTAAVSRGADTNSPFLVAWQQALPASLAGLGGHERVAAIAAAVDMDERSACAVLCGQRKRFYVHQTVALLGRESKSKGEVDINTSLEHSSTKVSRLQCFLEMDLSYGYLLRNIGRQTVFVNNIEVATGNKVHLPHMSLIEVGGVRFLFLVNVLALQRVTLHPPACPKDLIGL